MGEGPNITLDDDADPEVQRLAIFVYDGLCDKDIEEIERIALARGSFFGVRSDNFELVTSQLVIDEASAGDAVAAVERL